MNSILSKRVEIRCIVNKTITAIIGITGSKFDYIVPDSDVNLPGYHILLSDKNRTGIACYIRKDLCFNTRTLHCKKI